MEKDGIALDEPVKFLDHSMDAIRYALTSLKGYRNPASTWGGSTRRTKPEWA